MGVVVRWKNWTKHVAVCVFGRRSSGHVCVLGRRSSGHPSASPKRGTSCAVVGALVRANVAVSRWRSAQEQGARTWLGVSQMAAWDGFQLAIRNTLQLLPAGGSGLLPLPRPNTLQLLPAGGLGHPSAAERGGAVPF